VRQRASWTTLKSRTLPSSSVVCRTQPTAVRALRHGLGRSPSMRDVSPAVGPHHQSFLRAWRPDPSPVHVEASQVATTGSLRSREAWPLRVRRATPPTASRFRTDWIALGTFKASMGSSLVDRHRLASLKSSEGRAAMPTARWCGDHIDRLMLPRAPAARARPAFATGAVRSTCSSPRVVSPTSTECAHAPSMGISI
jgi:hypothetical protein